MRNLIATAFVSLDGVVEAPGGEPGYRNSGWTFKDIEFDPAAYEIKGREQAESTAIMMGRASYEAFSPVWPGMTEEFPGYNAMPNGMGRSQTYRLTAPATDTSGNRSAVFSLGAFEVSR